MNGNRLINSTNKVTKTRTEKKTEENIKYTTHVVPALTWSHSKVGTVSRKNMDAQKDPLKGSVLEKIKLVHRVHVVGYRWIDHNLTIAIPLINTEVGYVTTVT